MNRILNQEDNVKIEELRKSEKFFRLISENANDMISILNQRYKYEYINEKPHLDILGYDSDDLIGKSAWKLMHPDDISNFITVLKDKKRYEEIILELRVKHKNGDWIWTHSKGSMFKAENNEEKVLLVSRDITTRKNVEEKLKESENKYREAYTRANFYKNLFVHDISNIINIIKTASELCLDFMDSPNKSEMLKDYLSMIREQIIRGSKLIKNVHRLSEIEETKQTEKSMELCKVLKESVNYIYKSYKRKKLKIDIDLQSKKIFVQADNLLSEAFENILINAITNNDKPIVKISVKISEIEKNNRSYAKLEFIDNGIGISETRKELIFQEGYKKDKYTKGMGFGLTLVKKIINSYNGQVWVQDRVQGDYTKGANFVLLIPTR